MIIESVNLYSIFIIVDLQLFLFLLLSLFRRYSTTCGGDHCPSVNFLRIQFLNSKVKLR